VKTTQAPYFGQRSPDGGNEKGKYNIRPGSRENSPSLLKASRFSLKELQEWRGGGKKGRKRLILLSLWEGMK